MLVAIHQPHYLPWLRYFEKMLRSDVFIVLDTVQFSKNGWQNRNKIKTAHGTALLTVPVQASLDDTLETVSILDNGWRKKHWRTIEQTYRKAPFFEEHAGWLREVYDQEWALLNKLNGHMLKRFAEALGLRTRIVYASDLLVTGTATDRLVQLVKAVGGDTYYSGAFALDAYLDASVLEEAGIGLQLQHWATPGYAQLHGPFVPDLSILDLLFNCGPHAAGVLEEGGRT